MSRMKERLRSRDTGSRLPRLLSKTGRGFCENTSIDGFAYWVSSDSNQLSVTERVFWVLVTLASFAGAVKILKDTIHGWIGQPAVVSIETFSLPATSLAYPAITVCNGYRYDVGEYIRAVYNNFESKCSVKEDNCNATKYLRSHFKPIAGLHFVWSGDVGGDSYWPEQLMGFLEYWAVNADAVGYLNKFEHLREIRNFLVPFYFGRRSESLANGEVLWRLLGDRLTGVVDTDYWKEHAGVYYKSKKGNHRRIEPVLSKSGCSYPKTLRYYSLCRHARKSKYRDFWKALAKCHQTRMAESGGQNFRFTEAWDNYNKSCLEEQNPNSYTRKALANLTDFDVFVIGSVMNADGRFDDRAMRETFSRGIDGRWGYGDQLVLYCNATGCPYNTIIDYLSQMTLKLKMAVDTDFGKSLAAQPAFNYDGGSDKWDDSSDIFNDVNTQVISKSGYKALWNAVFDGNVTVDAFHGLSSYTHPLFFAEFYTTLPYKQLDSSPFPSIEANITEKLARILKFGAYLRAQVEAGRANSTELVSRELEKYPYVKKETFQDPYISPVDLSGVHNADFYPGLTDAGICHVYNGDTVASTFKEQQKTKELAAALDPRPSHKPLMITGTGKISERSFWLNVADRSLRNHVMLRPKRKGKALVAVNEWLSYYNVRINHLEVVAGKEAIIKIKPTSHVASENFKGLSIEKRKCLFKHENPDPLSMFNTYNENSCLFECRLKHAVDATIRNRNYGDGCVPWDYPRPLGELHVKTRARSGQSSNASVTTSGIRAAGIPIPGSSAKTKVYRFYRELKTCTSKSDNLLARFERVMNSEEAQNNCSCLPNCEEITFETQINTFDLDVDELCNAYGHAETMDRVMADWAATHSPTVHWYNEMSNRNYKERYSTFRLDDETVTTPGHTNMLYGLPADEAYRVCKEKYRNEVVKLTIQITNPNVMQIKHDVKVTFADQLSSVGGTLGLFAGVSLISLVEAAFWTYKMLKQLFGMTKATSPK